MNWIKRHTANHNPWLHAGFWSAWVVFFTLLQSLGQGSNSLFIWFWYYIYTLPVFVIHTYLVAYWLVPLTFLKGRYSWFIAGLIFLLLVFSVLELILSNELIFKGVNPAVTAVDGYLKPGNIIISGIGNHYIILAFMAIKVGKAWYGAKATEEEEKQRNLKTTTETYNYQFRAKVIFRLMTLLECGIKKDMKKSSELIILISNFFNEFLTESNKQEENFSREIKLLEMYLEIFLSALPNLVRTEFSAKGNLTSFSAPGYLFFPAVVYALNFVKCCNNSYRCAVSIIEEGKRLCFYLHFSSQKIIEQQENIDSEMLEKRLHKFFPGKVSFKEEKGNNYWKLEAEVF